ncbi:MAG: family phosphohydrolase, histidinol phosphatase [Bacteroidetes bacterium]|jgi:DNA polymerase (family 10)|nr:family phosphohydrolase, histidinol phosphatase [Bacteroidota bacterium]
MTTEEIADAIEFTAKLMELHGENPFKVKALASASYRLSKIHADLSNKSLEELEAMEGVGKSIAAKIIELQQTGTTKELETLKAKTPVGLKEVLEVKGLGPKKVSLLWKELSIESIGELLYACNENRLITLKGFGSKTQDEVKKSVEFKLSNQHKYHYAYAELIGNELLKKVKATHPDALISFTGALHRKSEIIDTIDILVEEDLADELNKLVKTVPYPFVIHSSPPENFYYNLVLTSSTQEHIEKAGLLDLGEQEQSSEEEVYDDLQLQYIVPELREGLNEVELAEQQEIGKLIEFTDLRGSLHNHSTYSDGVHTLREMAEECKALGYEYFGICDHSQTAVYAGGLKPDRIFEQQKEIDLLNAQSGPFKILKGIESDILSDGSLDYTEDVLKTFDFVVASIHQGFKMDEERATTRVIKAIENPYTKILGHPTGRLLLARPGYPIDHKKVIDACAANGVAIELNAHPYRLDIDWRWIPYCMEKKVMVSINPDAHAKSGFYDMYYGTCVARKGMLTKEYCLNVLSLKDIEEWFKKK